MRRSGLPQAARPGAASTIARMVRPAHLLYPPRVPVALRAAATVVLLRETGQGIEVLLTRRPPRASFAPGAYVFPGGGVDAADGSADAHAIASQRPGQGDLRLTQAITAIRECYEALGVLLARDAHGQPVGAQDVARLDRAACAASAGAFIQQCSAMGLVLAADQVHVLAHWITDRDQPRRFDVPFLVARMPAGQAVNAGAPGEAPSPPSGCGRATRWRGTARAPCRSSSRPAAPCSGCAGTPRSTASCRPAGARRRSG